MPTRSSGHPPRQLLAAFGLGKLSISEATLIEEHLRECQSCCETLTEMPEDDTFVALLRGHQRLPDGQPAPLVHSEESEALADATIDLASSPAGGLADLPPELRDHGRYRIVERIGAGGMGTVFKAEHRLMNRLVAVKVINPKLVQHATALERFRREVQAAAQLTHPNIVTAYDAEQAGEAHYLVMEYVPGIDLSQVVKQQGPLPIPRACDFARQVAGGLQHAFEKGMVHRDIKPHNLMLAPDGMIKILDFGLATLSTAARADPSPQADGQESSGFGAAHLTSADSTMGTPDFISPEQAQDARSVDIRSDIYSLGCTLYYLLSGSPPFSEGSVMDKMRAHAALAAQPLDSLRVDVPAELADVVRRMMDKDPAKRYQTPAEVADALAPFVDHHRTDSPWTAVAKDAGKPPAVAGAGALTKWRAFALGAACIVALGAIYVANDQGELVIRSADETLAIAVRPLTHESREGSRYRFQWRYRLGDTVVGSATKKLRSGAYTVFLEEREDEFELSQNRFVLSRGGKVVITITRKERSLTRVNYGQIQPGMSATQVTELLGNPHGKSWFTAEEAAHFVKELYDISSETLVDPGNVDPRFEEWVWQSNKLADGLYGKTVQHIAVLFKNSQVFAKREAGIEVR